jgi:hypothetical protein
LTLSLQEISDRLEIQDTITRYSHGLDQRLWDQWDLAFTPDAVIDFSPVGLTEHTPASARELFTAGDPTRISGQHLLTNTLITLDGDRATARSEFSMFTMARAEEPDHAVLVQGGGWYEDELARTGDGWRMTRRAAFTKWHKAETIPWRPAAS